MDKRLRFWPYLEVRGTAIPLYCPLEGLNKLLNDVYNNGKATQDLTHIENLDDALNALTAGGWSDHVQYSKNFSSKQGTVWLQNLH